MTPVNELAQIATQLISRIRDDEPAANAAWLTGLLPDPADWFRLAFVLAAAVPDDRSWRQLTAWTWKALPAKARGTEPPPGRRELQPCGTPAAATRHKYRKEAVCKPCRDAVRAYDREHRRIAREAAA